MILIKAFNETIDYIESVLEDEIDEKRVAALSGYSYAMFSRLFSILTEMTLTEYIRSRRLSLAALTLRDSELKVIDIAMRYGYESADAFTNAFKNFHGYTPSDIRKGKPFKIMSRLQLRLSVSGGRKMNAKVERKAAFTVAGIDRKNITAELCPSVWGELYDKYSHEQLAALGQGQSVGMTYDTCGPELINYVAGYMIDDLAKAQEMGLDLLEIDEAEYAIIELKGSVPECIHEGWKYALEVFLPEHGYKHTGAPEFEYYYERDMESADYQMELWIPIVKG